MAAINKSGQTGTKIVKCSCLHTEQDKMYGKQNRLANHAPSKNSKPKRYRCTVCQREHEVN